MQIAQCRAASDHHPHSNDTIEGGARVISYRFSPSIGHTVTRIPWIDMWFLYRHTEYSKNSQKEEDTPHNHTQKMGK
jgi:hypothetical protein